MTRISRQFYLSALSLISSALESVGRMSPYQGEDNSTFFPITARCDDGIIRSGYVVDVEATQKRRDGARVLRPTRYHVKGKAYPYASKRQRERHQRQRERAMEI